MHKSSLNTGLSPMVVSPALLSDGTLPIDPDIAAEDATTGTVATNSRNGDAQEETAETSAYAAFSFLEWSFSFNRDGPAGGAHSTPTHMPYDAARDTLFAAPTFASGTPLTCASAVDSAALNMTDLFLLHHFTTVTARSLCPWHAEVQQWWTHEVPRVAVRHPFVMRSLLTVAGLHVAYLAGSGDSADNMDQSGDGTGTPAFHIARAIEQHKLAGQTAASMLPRLDRATSAPMYVFSVLTQIISMAMPWSHKDPSSPVTWDSIGVHEWIRLLRGVRTISDLGQEWGVEGDAFLGGRNAGTMPRQLYRELFEGRARAGSDGRDPVNSSSENHPERRSRWHVMHQPPLEALKDCITADIDGVEMESEEKDEMRDICLKELDQLDFVFASFLDHGESIQTVRLIFSWLCRLEARFLDSLSRHDPNCLLVFTYHAVLLHWTDRAWWMEGWGPRIIDSVSSILGGADSKYKEWLKWPRIQVGLPELG
ncbi:hypothetical protein N0V82_009311 [Gnomoniopsis sp. IMI 355080]|nr:hypothetical protein N0V82_009311 [Gnomoniopsis sp. IMI 355080]